MVLVNLAHAKERYMPDIEFPISGGAGSSPGYLVTPPGERALGRHVGSDRAPHAVNLLEVASFRASDLPGMLQARARVQALEPFNA